jgi:cardiolipin synthase A/B
MTVIVETPWYSRVEPDYCDGNDLVLLSGGKDFFAELEAQLDLAQKEVFVETYIFEYDASGKRIASALARAAKRGVAVHVVIDGFGSKGINPDLIQIFASGPVQWQVFRPEKKYITLERQRLRRLHRKLSVIDGAVAFVGGINMLDDYNDPNWGALEHPRFDFAVRVRGPLVASIHHVVSRMWWQLSLTRRKNTMIENGTADAGALSRTRLALPESVVSVVDAIGHLRAKFIPRDNFRFRAAIENSYLRAIERAKVDVVIANAYFLPGIRFRRALIHAAKRGVRVRLLLQGIAEYKLQHWATQALYQELLQAGVEIFEYKRSFLHAKVAVADDWATVGSSNIDPFSLLLAREANVVVTDPDFAKLLRQQIEQGVTEGAKQVIPQEHLRLSWAKRLVHKGAFIVLRIAVALTGAAGRY